MEDNQSRISDLSIKLDRLIAKQNEFTREINSLKDEIQNLRNIPGQASVELKKTADKTTEQDVKPAKPMKDLHSENSIKYFHKPSITKELSYPANSASNQGVKNDLEKFIGENLLNKIGIIITILGIAIGVKYSIDHELISPVTRILSGYIGGIAMMIIGLKLKKNYENFSAVLVSGSMAVMYFITYAAYQFYALIPQLPSFILMLIFTVVTVVTAIWYDRQIIALIGLVGAYAIPLILSDNSGRTFVLFTYMTIINLGILFLSFRKYWKTLFYAAFIITWILFIIWFSNKFNAYNDTDLSLGFSTTFYTIFYLTFIAFKLIRKEIYELDDVLLLLANSFIYYAIGYVTLDHLPDNSQYLGLFTASNAIIHTIVGFAIYSQKLADKNLFYLVAGLAILFLTIAIPVQLDGNWVTFLWTGEVALLFGIGRTKKAPLYELLSYPLIILSALSLNLDWLGTYQAYIAGNDATWLIPLLNITFLTSFIFLISMAFITWLSIKKPLNEKSGSIVKLAEVMNIIVPVIFILYSYFTFRLEISNYIYQLYEDSYRMINVSGIQESVRNENLMHFKSVWVINYTLLFISLLTIYNYKKLQNKDLAPINLGLLVFGMLLFLGLGLYELSELRYLYIHPFHPEIYTVTGFNLAIRYISFIFIAITLILLNNFKKLEYVKNHFSAFIDLTLASAIIWILSSELINIMDLAGSSQEYKLGLSLLWGTYSLFIIIIGIWKQKKYLRFGAMGLFGLTLIKLFFYDIAHLSTISKTVVFISLGVLLLIISFLYNKYKKQIGTEI